jgi:RNA polymerase sigma-70 factor (ECF subfamily)
MGRSEERVVEATALATADKEAALVPRLRDGDEAAFTTLVSRYHTSLVRLALAFVSSRAVAEEVVQETWIAVLEGIGRFEERSSLRTWIYRIVTNRARTRGVRESRTVPFSSLAGDGDPEPAVDPARFTPAGSWAAPPRRWDEETPEVLLSRAETRTLIDRAIEGLPPMQRAVVTLRDVSGCSAEEVCNILDVSETNQRVLLHRARSELRAALEAHRDQ